MKYIGAIPFLLVMGILMSIPAMSEETPRRAPTSDELAKLVAGRETPEALRALADELDVRYADQTPPEAIRMLITIARGELMGGSDGWFGPGQSRYSWEWLAAKHGISPSDSLKAAAYLGTPDTFARLDRNQNGEITAEDLDWSDRNPWVQQAAVVNRLLRRLDSTGNGSLTREEWQQFFDRIAGDRAEVRFEEVRERWLGGMAQGFLPGDAPTIPMLIEGLVRSEVGSLQEGPSVGDAAPDFTLKTHDGMRTVRLSETLGSRPVVLVFGNFTCGPFRSLYPGVEDVFGRFQDRATFLGVYVREAHPTDGWKMESNARVGVAVPQPKSYEERKAVAQQCHRLLKPVIPLLVDEIDDRTGNAYSGMPARLYVIDSRGQVAYKSGRGPFGFKVGEMEQALVMTLLDEQ